MAPCVAGLSKRSALACPPRSLCIAHRPQDFDNAPDALRSHLSCANRPGIGAAVSTALFEGGLNILDAQQFDDTENRNFLMRIAFNGAGPAADAEAIRAVFAAIADNLR